MNIHGRNVVISALETKQTIKKILISKTAHGDGITRIKHLAKNIDCNLQFVANQILDRTVKTDLSHQGVVAEIDGFHYESIDRITEKIKNSKIPLLTIILDQITDPHNLGAIIRTAECAGSAGIIIAQNNSATINATVLKVSVGSAFHLPVIKSSNLIDDIQLLKRHDILLYATVSDAEKSYTEIDKTKHAALIIGNESTGIRKMIKNQVDELIKIPLSGKTESLNASVAAGICIYEFMTK